ncbi:MAG: hypothetical protein ABJB85_08395 [Nitrososphaerota archaeon]
MLRIVVVYSRFALHTIDSASFLINIATILMSHGAEDEDFKQTDKGELLTLMLAYD